MKKKVNFHTIADDINTNPTHHIDLFVNLEPSLQAKVLLHLSYRSKRILLPKLESALLLTVLELMDSDDATDLLQHLKKPRREDLLKQLNEDKRKHIEKLIKYHPETAGGIMDLNFVIIKPDFTIQDVAKKIKRYSLREHKSPLLITAKDDGTITGYVPYHQLVLAKHSDKVKDITRKLPLISAKMGRKKLVQLASRKKMDVAGVVDEKSHILGVVHLSDLGPLLTTEATHNLYQFAGVSREEDMLDSPQTAVKHRQRWLIINLATAFMAAFTVSLFEDTIAQLAILAIFMPIVAGMGGNAGNQTLAVVIRGIALGELKWTTNKHIIAKEVTAALWNSLIISLISIPIALVLSRDIALALVLGSSMIVTMIIAGFFGATIPLTLKALKIDPAVASSVFLTTATDIFGFFIFLGLATIVLL